MSRTFQQTYRSSTFKSLVYIKKSMKQILAQRTQILKKLDILPSPKSPLNLKQQQSIIQTIRNLFKQYPVNLQEHQLLVIKQKIRYYVFFSCDDSFIPVCIKCFKSVYFTFSKGELRIICTNVTCKQCLLENLQILGEEQFIEQKERKQQNIKTKQLKRQSKDQRSTSRNLISFQQRQLEMIQKASKNILK